MATRSTDGFASNCRGNEGTLIQGIESRSAGLARIRPGELAVLQPVMVTGKTLAAGPTKDETNPQMYGTEKPAKPHHLRPPLKIPNRPQATGG